MLDTRVWICAPQVRDLPRDLEVDMTCTGCGRRRTQSVREMVEVGRLGAQFMDLLEWETRCADAVCGGRVRFDYAGKAAYELPAPQVMTLPRVKLPERPVWPVKTGKRRQPAPQYTLPMALPMAANRRAQPQAARMAS